MEWTLQQQGFDLCYDKRLYDRLAHEAAEAVRGHLAGRRRLPGAAAALHREPRRAARRRHVRAGAGARGGGRHVHAPGRPPVPRRPARGPPHAHPRVPRPRPGRAAGRGPARVLRALLRAVADSGLRDGDWRLCDCEGWPDNDSHGSSSPGAGDRGRATSSSSTSPTRRRRRGCACRGTTWRGRSWTLTDRLTAPASSAPETSSPPRACTSPSTPGSRTSSARRDAGPLSGYSLGRWKDTRSITSPGTAPTRSGTTRSPRCSRSSPARPSSSRSPTRPAGSWAATHGVEAVAALDFSRVNPVTGPVFVKGAGRATCWRPRSSSLRPRDWGWTAIIPGFGLLAEEFPEPWLRISTIDAAAGA